MLPSGLAAPFTETFLPASRSLKAPSVDFVIFVESERKTIFDPPSCSLTVTLLLSLAIISPAVNLVMAQRLVRVLCQACKKENQPTEEEKIIILKEVAALPPAYNKNVHKDFKIWKSAGCEACNMTGYKGRIGIFEAFLIDDEMERLIIKNPPQADIEEAAIAPAAIIGFRSPTAATGIRIML